jgi:hypothetical protein
MGTKRSHISICPKCKHRSFEHLKTYSHCVNCFHVDDKKLEGPAVPLWAQKEYRAISQYFDFQWARLNGGRT